MRVIQGDTMSLILKVISTEGNCRVPTSLGPLYNRSIALLCSPDLFQVAVGVEVKSQGNKSAPLTGSALTAEGFGDTRLSVASSLGQMNPVPPRVPEFTHWDFSFSRGKKRSLLNPCC